MKNIEVMKNITAMEKTAIVKNNNEEYNSKNNNCFAVFFGILFFDDMLSSPRIRTNKKAGLVCGGESLFFGAEIEKRFFLYITITPTNTGEDYNRVWVWYAISRLSLIWCCCRFFQ